MKESLEKLEAKNIERQNEEALKNKKIQFEQKKKDYEQLVNTINKVIKENEDIDMGIGDWGLGTISLQGI